jgi:hypothetical protein
MLAWTGLFSDPCVRQSYLEVLCDDAKKVHIETISPRTSPIFQDTRHDIICIRLRSFSGNSWHESFLVWTCYINYIRIPDKKDSRASILGNQTQPKYILEGWNATLGHVHMPPSAPVIIHTHACIIVTPAIYHDR